MYMHLILPIAVFLTFVAACFVVAFQRLASRVDATQCTTEWLDGLSLERYSVMERLLKQSDLDYLAAQPGYKPEIGARLMAERRDIFAMYLGQLIRDFNQLAAVGKLMIIYSAQDKEEFARSLFRQQVRFYYAVCFVRVELALYPVRHTGADVRRLVDALTAMRNQVVSLEFAGQTN
jgi:hypothetical protein